MWRKLLAKNTMYNPSSIFTSIRITTCLIGVFVLSACYLAKGVNTEPSPTKFIGSISTPTYIAVNSPIPSSNPREFLLTSTLDPATVIPDDPTLTPILTPTQLIGRLAFAIFNYQSGESEIAIMSVEDQKLQKISKDIGPAIGSGPSWSPDGKKVAYYWFQTGSDDYIRIIDLEKNTDEALIQGSYPAFSPDGKQIAFIRAENLYILNLQNMRINRASTLPGSAHPVWSPDGTRIAFLSTGGKSQINADLFVVDVATYKVKQVNLDIQAGWGRLSWSPNEKEIAFRSLKGCGDICLVDVDSGKTKCLTNSKEGEKDPTWSPDGQWIVYLSLSDTNFCSDGSEAFPLDWRLYYMKSDGSDAKPLSINKMDTTLTITGPEISR